MPLRFLVLILSIACGCTSTSTDMDAVLRELSPHDGAVLQRELDELERRVREQPDAPWNAYRASLLLLAAPRAHGATAVRKRLAREAAQVEGETAFLHRLSDARLRTQRELSRARGHSAALEERIEALRSIEESLDDSPPAGGEP